MTRSELRAAIEAALSEYAQDRHGDFGRLHCFREINELIKTADFYIHQRPGETVDIPEEERPWPALRAARGQ